MAVQHVEFFHKHHFEYHYHRVWAKGVLAQFIDFFWETDFDALWSQYPEGFSDALFPNTGYTYLINLGTPFIMQLDKEAFEMKRDGFLPRYKNIICYHSAGNKLFGIKFKVSPVLFQKKVNFSEYREYIFPLAYLIEPKIVERVKSAASFSKRVEILSGYYNKIIEQYSGSLKPVSIVTEILDCWNNKKDFTTPIEEIAARYRISSRTLHRYFEVTTSNNTKRTLQVIRIRKAVEQLAYHPENFHYADYGYYDYSHFYKHLKTFINRHLISIVQPHLKLLKGTFEE